MVTRRELLIACTAVAVASSAYAAERADKALKRIQKRVGGRVGVHVLDSQSGKRIGIDDDSRYAMASTFKLPLAAAILWQVDRKAFPLEREMPVSKSDLLANSPAVEAKIAASADTMTIRELCRYVASKPKAWSPGGLGERAQRPSSAGEKVVEKVPNVVPNRPSLKGVLA